MEIVKKQPSEKEIYIWNITGSMANAMFSVVALMFVTRVLSNDKTDIFSIAWSISQLMATIGTYQIRTLQATDVKERFGFKQYFSFRILTIVVMMLCSVAYVMVKHYEVYKSVIVIIVCAYRAVESLTDVYEGWLQQKERLDLVGKAISYRIFLTVIACGISLILTHSLMAFSVMLLLSGMFGLFFWDIRYYMTLWKTENTQISCDEKSWLTQLFVAGTPLFINAFLMMNITNTPKMEIDSAIMDKLMISGSQTIFNILFMPASVLTLVYIVFRPLLTKMAIEWMNGHKRKFIIIIGKIMGCLAGIGVIVVIASYILGIPVLSILYALDLSKYKTELLIIIVGGCFCTFSYVLDNALVVIRKQYLLVCAYGVSWIYVKIFAPFAVVKWNLRGAALAYMTSMIIFFVATLVIFIVCMERERKHE